MRFRPSPYLLLTLAMLFWSGNFVLGRAVHADMPPISMNFWRWVGAAIILLPFTVRPTWEYRATIIRHWRVITILAVTGISLFNSLAYLALKTTSAINASLTVTAVPVVIPILVFLMYGERLSGRQALGITISLAGVVTIIARADWAGLAALKLLPGDLWMLIAVVCWGVYSVMLRQRPPELPALAFIGVTIALGIAALLPFYAWELSVTGGFALSQTNVLSIVYFALFPSAVSFIFWNRGVAEVGAVKAGLIYHLLPVFSAILALLFLGERIEAYHLGGLALILAGIYLTTTAPGTWRRLLQR